MLSDMAFMAVSVMSAAFWVSPPSELIRAALNVVACFI